MFTPEGVEGGTRGTGRGMPPGRAAVVAAVAVLALHFLLTVRVFTPREQFTKYPSAAALYLEQGLPTERLQDFSPAYLQVHVLARRHFADPAAAVLVFQLCLVGATAGALFLLLRHHFGVAVAVAGTAAFSLDPTVIIHGQIFEPEALLSFFLTAFLASAALPGRMAPLASGGFLALAVATRPSLLLLAVLAPLCFLASGEGGGGFRAARAGVFLVPVAILLAATAPGRGHDGVGMPVSMNPGTVFYEGNNPSSRGQASVSPPLFGDLQRRLSTEPDANHIVYRIMARRVAGKDLSVAGVNAWWAEKALNFAGDHPGAFLRTLGGKARRVFQAYRQHDTLVAHLLDRRLAGSAVPTFPFAVLAALALAGVGWSLAFLRRFLLPAVTFLALGASLVVFNVSDRQRACLVPVLVLFAGLALARVRERPRRGAAVLLACIPLAWALSLDDDLALERTHGMDVYDRTTAATRQVAGLREEGRLREAADLSARTLTGNPLVLDGARYSYLDFGPEGFAGAALEASPPPTTYPERLDRALLLLEAGRPGEAATLLEEMKSEKRLIFRHALAAATPEYYLALARLRLGDRPAALENLGGALARAPGDPHALALALALTGERKYGEELFRYLDDVDAAFLLGLAYRETGNPVREADALDYVARMVPEFFLGHAYLAAALGRAGLLDEGLEAFRVARSMGADPAVREGDILFLLRQVAERDGPNSRAGFEYAVALGQYGHFEQSLELLARIEKARPDPEVDRHVTYMRDLIAARDRR